MRHRTCRIRGRLVFIGLLALTAPFLARAQEKPATESQAPGFSLQSVTADSTIRLSDFVDKKIVIVHFWKSR
jgi:hypothetical protein